MPISSTEQRVYDAAENAYLSEGGHLAPIGNALAQDRATTAAGPRDDGKRWPRAGHAADEYRLTRRFGITRSGRVYCYAQRRDGNFYDDARARVSAAAKRPH